MRKAVLGGSLVVFVLLGYLNVRAANQPVERTSVTAATVPTTTAPPDPTTTVPAQVITTTTTVQYAASGVYTSPTSIFCHACYNSTEIPQSPMVWYVATGGWCSQTSQAEAQQDGLQVVPASECPNYRYTPEPTTTTTAPPDPRVHPVTLTTQPITTTTSR